ncbi:MAG: AAA family ATPase [Alphaproteobacteria bacterium]|nr:AAA family ATPase [Alphaproteobacteria bacterium]
MISAVSFQQYKLLRSVSMELGRLNVIVGRNGAGKSTVLEGLHTLLGLPHPTEQVGGVLHRVFGDAGRVASLLSKPDASWFELHVTGRRASAAKAEFSLTLTVERHGDLRPRCRLELLGEGRTRRFGVAESHDDTDLLRAAYHLELASVVRLRLQGTRLAAPHYSETAVPRLEHDGEGLASVLQYLQGLRDGTLEVIEQRLAGLIPGARRVRAVPTRIPRIEQVVVAIDGRESLHEKRSEVTGTRFEVEFDGLGWIEADQLSEGTLLVLGLLTLLHHRPPSLVLIDDLDAGLHPMAQQQLIAVLRTLLDERPDLQVVATSHSPFVLDALDAKEAFVAGVEGVSAHVRRLDAHPAWKKRKGYLHPGEFWSAVGEGWVAEEK